MGPIVMRPSSRACSCALRPRPHPHLPISTSNANPVQPHSLQQLHRPMMHASSCMMVHNSNPSSAASPLCSPVPLGYNALMSCGVARTGRRRRPLSDGAPGSLTDPSTDQSNDLAAAAAAVWASAESAEAAASSSAEAASSDAEAASAARAAAEASAAAALNAAEAAVAAADAANAAASAAFLAPSAAAASAFATATATAASGTDDDNDDANVAAAAAMGGFMECSIEDPDGYISSVVRGSRLKYDDPSGLPLRRRALLQWEPGRPTHVLLVKKPKNADATERMLQIGQWLQQRGLTALVEPLVHATELPQFQVLDETNRQQVDFCITLGGDGTVLHLASLFDSDEALPPVMSFSMGTLGFLTPFDVRQYEALLTRVLAADVEPLYCTLRTRLRCEIRSGGKVQAVHNVLNEVVVDRGAYPGPAVLEVFVDRGYLTTVEADGLIIATPSGSTAYSMSAGGSLIAPSVPCTILTPIAPLSLSFRPIVVPESSSICVQVPHYAKCTTRISFDGRKATRLTKGASVVVETTRNPLPMINLSHLDSDWYEGITQKLKWNLSLRPTPRPLGYDDGLGPPSR